MSIITSVDQNVFLINADLVNYDELKRYIIDEKVKRINNGFQFSLDDLVLVRSIKESLFPANGYYYPLNEENCYKGTLNPFNHFLSAIRYGYDKNYVGDGVFDHEEEKAYVYHPVYRDTKHFTINSLSSNINRLFVQTAIFNNRPIIIIEPLKEKIDNGLLVNLNPIDTFFNLHNTRMEVSSQAIILINEDTYKELIRHEENKEILNTHKIYLFRGEPSISCDIALLSLGILPQHSIGQRELIEEYYHEGSIEISDKKYLKLFRNYIEYLNQTYLKTSYIHLPKDIIESRKNYEHMYPGLLHVNTHFSDEETVNMMNNIISTYADYMEFLSAYANGEFKSNVDNMITLIDADVKQYYPRYRFNFMDLHEQYGNIMKEFLRNMTYKGFIDVTHNFNEKQLSKINKTKIG